MNLISRIGWISVLYIVLMGVLLSYGVLAGESRELDEWILSHVNENEKLICQKEKEKDYFFVSRNLDKLKTGYRINITGEGGKSKSIIVSWGFKNAKGDFIGLSGEPIIESAKFIQIENSKYYEEIAYYNVSIDSKKVVDVAIGIKKYSAGSVVPTRGEFNDSDLEEFIICKGVLIEESGFK